MCTYVHTHERTKHRPFLFYNVVIRKTILKKYIKNPSEERK